MTYVTSGILGVDYTSTPTTAEFALGQVSCGSDGTEWIYVQASGAITQYDAVGIDENYQCAALTTAIADDAHRIGFAQSAFADNDYGWVAIRGTNISVRAAASCAADVSLYTTGTAGVVDDTSASVTKILGVTAVTAASAGGVTTLEVIAAYPFVELPA